MAVASHMMLQQYSVTSFVCPVMLCTMPLIMQFCPTGGLDEVVYSVIGQARNAYKLLEGAMETISLAASQNEQRHRAHCIELGTRMVSP